MKHFILIILFFAAFTSLGFAQKIIPSSIFIIDPQNGAQVPATSDAANLFKNAFIDLVLNTNTAKTQAIARFGPGKRSFIITQLDPQANGNVYQLSLQRVFLGQTNIVYTFQYNLDQNALSYFDPISQTWILQVVQGNNLINLNNCLAYGKFNVQNVAADNQQAPQAADQNNQPQNNAVTDSITTTTQPPPLQDEVQPECPTEGYLWQPGNWQYNPATGSYFWVPGVWVAAPTVGYLWTPPYWGFVNGIYVYNPGYWGNTIGFYGGINYGFGYAGAGFVGGEWYGGHFRYNTAVMRVNASFHYTYVNNAVVYHGVRNRAAFNGHGGVERAPTESERAEMNRHATEVRANRQTRTFSGPVKGPGVPLRGPVNNKKSPGLFKNVKPSKLPVKPPVKKD